MKKILNFLFHRITIMALAVLLQVVILIVFILQLNSATTFMYNMFRIFTVFILIWLLKDDQNPFYKHSWVLIIMGLSPVGGIFYLLWGNTKNTRSVYKRMEASRNMVSSLTERHSAVMDKYSALDPQISRVAKFVAAKSASPMYENTYSRFYSLGDYMYTDMLEELNKAQKLIFMEYFIVSSGVMWDNILEILKRKAAQGVEVRFMYDDAGCAINLPAHYYRKLNAMGIKTRVFNHLKPRMNSFMNYRDHRKICIVDGNCGFSGGINLADEYINRKVKYGHWKDTGFMLKGEAVWSLTVQFLEIWYFSSKHVETHQFTKYRPDNVYKNGDSYVQPFGDSPLDNVNVAETAYMSLINKASSYVYITTPYLILDNEMVLSLTSAAISGVDVRILTPGIADKWYVHFVTQSYYKRLIEAGVKIYEYSKGFLHAKMIVTDDKAAIIGSINMDFRSFYLHFENGTVFYGSHMIDDVKNDILDTINQCELMTNEKCNVGTFKRVMQTILRIFAPLF